VVDLTVINFEEKKKQKQVESNAADSWSATDVLLTTLKDLESGELNPKALIVIYAQDDDEGDTMVGFRVSSTDTLVTQGMLSRISWFLNE